MIYNLLLLVLYLFFIVDLLITNAYVISAGQASAIQTLSLQHQLSTFNHQHVI